MVNTTCHALFSGWPLRKQSDMTLVRVSQRASPSCQVIYGFVYLSKSIVCACFLCIYWCWINPVRVRVRVRVRGNEQSRRIRLGNRYRTYFSVLTFSHSTGPGYQAVTWLRSLYPDRTKMIGHIEGATVFRSRDAPRMASTSDDSR